MQASTPTACRESAVLLFYGRAYAISSLTVAASFSSLQAGKKFLAKCVTGEGALDEVAVQILQDVGQVAESNGAHAVQDLLVALLGDNALLGVALAVAEAEQLLEDVLEVQLTAPARSPWRRAGPPRCRR